MNLKRLLCGIGLSVIVISIGQVVHADEADGLNKVANANVELVAGTDTITPSPIKPYPPTGPMLPVGELGITSATNLYFDTISLKSSITTREALYILADGEKPISNVKNATGTLPTIPTDGSAYVPGYSVTDRRGTGTGWNLSLQLGDFIQQNVTTGTTAKTLKGAQLSFPEVVPITATDASQSVAPVTLAKKFEAGGSAKVLMNAEKEQGMGIWEARYPSRELVLSDGSTSKKEPIELSVPGNNYVGHYKANLVWLLADAPAASNAE